MNHADLAQALTAEPGLAAVPPIIKELAITTPWSFDRLWAARWDILRELNAGMTAKELVVRCGDSQRVFGYLPHPYEVFRG